MATGPRFAAAACFGLDPAIFFPRRGGDIKTPKSICRHCPARAPCAEWALSHERFGVWGGLTEQERSRERRLLGLPLPALLTYVPQSTGRGYNAQHLQGSVSEMRRRSISNSTVTVAVTL